MEETHIDLRRKKALSFSLALMLILSFMPGLDIAAAESAGCSYIAYSSEGTPEKKNTGSTTVTPVTAETAVLSSEWYIVDRNITCSGTITVTGSVNLILADHCTLRIFGTNDSAGIRVSPGNSLTIYAQSTDKAVMGALTAEGCGFGAGIGGGYGEGGGMMTIHGSIVEASGMGVRMGFLKERTWGGGAGSDDMPGSSGMRGSFSVTNSDGDSLTAIVTMGGKLLSLTSAALPTLIMQAITCLSSAKKI